MIYYIFTTLLLCANSIIQTSEPDSLSATEQLFRHIILNEPGAEYPNTYTWKCLDTKTISLLACINKEWKALHEKYIQTPRNEFIEKHKDLFSIQKNTLIFNPDKDYFFVGTDIKTKTNCIVWGSNDNFTVKTDPFPTMYLSKTRTIYSMPVTMCDKNEEKNKKIHIFQINCENDLYCFIPNKNDHFHIHTDYISFYEHNNSRNNLTLASCRAVSEKIVHNFFALSEDPAFWKNGFTKDNLTMSHIDGKYTLKIENPRENTHFKGAFTNIDEINALATKLNTPCEQCCNIIMNTKCKEIYKTIFALLDKEKLEKKSSNKLKKNYQITLLRNHTWKTTECTTNNGKLICVNAFNEIGFLNKTDTGTTLHTKKDEPFLYDVTHPPHVEIDYEIDDDEMAKYKLYAQNNSYLWKQHGNIISSIMSTTESNKVTFHWFSSDEHKKICEKLKEHESIENCIAHLIKKDVVIVTTLKNSNDLLFLNSALNATHAKTFPCKNIQGLKKGFVHYLKKISKQSLNNPTYRITDVPSEAVEQFFTLLKTEMPALIAKVLDKANYNPFDHTT